jgi:cell fate regulator YaaT (PSP1 superfamily)
MSQILGIKFNDYSQVYYFSSGPFVVREGQRVIVKTDQGMGLGKVVMVRQAPPEGEASEEHKAIYRLANDEDLASLAENDDLSREAYDYCRQCIDTHGLEMKLVDVEVFFDRSKMIFYFTAPGRIDFRELIKDLVRQYRTRIELRQIGVRHETQMLGAIGNCGQVCCCRRFMRKFVPVTIKMAKEQNLFLNPTKISGICGRLLCCLSFEQEAYEEFHKQCPKVGRKYPTALGQAKVLRSNFFNKTLSLYTEFGEEHEVSLDEWNDIVNKPVGEGIDRPLGPVQGRPRRKPPRRGGPPAQKGAAATGRKAEEEKVTSSEKNGTRSESRDGGDDASAKGAGEGRPSRRKNSPAKKGSRSGSKPGQRKPKSGDAASANAGDEKPKRPRRRRRRRPSKPKQK